MRQPAPPRLARAPHARGFTLIEILVVVTIAAVLVAALVLAAGGSGGRELENAAQRARALVELACERAVLGGRDIGFAPVTEGLRFGYFELDGWHEVDDRSDDELRPRALGEGIEMLATRDGEPLRLDHGAPTEPPFACLSSGELTPFTLDFSRPGVPDIWRLEGRLDGSLTLVANPDAR